MWHTPILYLKYSSPIHFEASKDCDDSIDMDSPGMTEFDSPIRRVGIFLPVQLK